MKPDKADNLIWWLMVTFMGIIILGGGAWAATINAKVDEISNLKANVAYIQRDISEIRAMVQDFTGRKL